VREHRVRVLEERNEDQPRVDPEVRYAIGAHHGPKSKRATRVNKGRNPQQYAHIRNDDVVPLMICENDRRRLEVVGEAWIRALASRVGDEVHWPAEEQLERAVRCSKEGRVAYGLPHFRHHFVGDADPERVVDCTVQGRKTEFGTCFWDEDLVEVHVACACMVAGMADTPGVIWDAEAVRGIGMDGIERLL